MRGKREPAPPRPRFRWRRDGPTMAEPDMRRPSPTSEGQAGPGYGEFPVGSHTLGLLPIAIGPESPVLPASKYQHTKKKISLATCTRRGTMG
jgi:hypothetical protein